MRRFGKVKKTGIRALTVLLIAALVIPQAILALGDGSDSTDTTGTTSLENAGGGGLAILAAPRV
jgi:hypothetical protein